MKQYGIMWLLILVLVASGCDAKTTPTPASTDQVHPELKNIPLYPESTGWKEGLPGVTQYPEGYQVYSYIARVFKPGTIGEFYEENMSSNGWELFSTREEDNIGNRKSITLLFSKGKDIAEIVIMEWTSTSCLVSVNFFDDP
ncbi:MAG: hypothetical protein ABI621_19595 [Chloroflexota bacterium]